MTAPLEVEIWSDIQCPFCYIGKRQFEQALEAFPQKDRVKITWRSYQLDPSLKAQPGESIYAYLARRKGMTEDQSKKMHDQVARSAASVGLDYQFDKMIVANSHAGHRLIQRAKAEGCGDRAEEVLFHGYFTDGYDLADRDQLVELAQKAGLTEAQAVEALDDPTGRWGQSVDQEAAEAQDLGCTGVPFFVFGRKYGVTGAQGAPTFAQVLNKLAEETPAG